MIDQKAARVAGAVATLVALAVLWILSGFLSSVAFPPTAIAAFIIRATPGDVATAFIELLQHWAIRGLAVAVVLGTIFFGAMALVWSSRKDRLRAAIAAAVLLVVSVAAAVIDPMPGSVLATGAASVVAAVIYVVVARSVYSTRVAPELPVALPEPGVEVTRRRMLALGAGSALGLAAAGGAIGWIARRLAGPNRDVTIVAPGSPATIPERAPFPDIPGLSPEVTSAAEHYVVDIDLVKPLVEADTWTLSVLGEVVEPLDFSFDSLQSSFEVVENYSVLTCISNEVGGPLVGHSRWAGVRLADVLERVGVRDGVIDVVFHAADGYTDSIPLEVAMDRNVLVAVAQNGEPLTQQHGFPCRVRIPGIYGMKNVKWLQRIELVKRDYKGYWMRRGWSDVATVRTQSRIDVAGNENFKWGVGAETWIAGVAWAGDRGISKVEVSVDGGDTWNEAMLKDPISEKSWRLWAYRWTPEDKGTVTVTCRATDGAGEVQPAEFTPPHPSGATGRHTVEVSVE